MNRTTIVIPPELQAKAKRLAKDRGVSFAELVRTTLAAEVEAKGNKRASVFDDLPDDPRRSRAAPSDAAENHDLYLYGPARKGRTRR